MNWLAHLVLSDAHPAFRVGNLLADILPVGELRALPPPFQPGILRHRAIDKFTDSHPVFRQSIARLDPKYRRFGGVVMDIFYDHLLTVSWREHVPTTLDAFVERFHADVEICRRDIPAGAYTILHRMRTGAWLTSYGDIDGVGLTLHRIGKRLRRPFDLGEASGELQRHYPVLSEDFGAFFPQIKQRFSMEQQPPNELK